MVAKYSYSYDFIMQHCYKIFNRLTYNYPMNLSEHALLGFDSCGVVTTYNNVHLPNSKTATGPALLAWEVLAWEVLP